MASSNTFHCSVITPERNVLECNARFVAFPAHDGEMGVLTQRAPLVCKLGIGLLRIEAADPDSGSEPSRDDYPSRDSEGTGTTGKHVFFIDRGFAQMLNNRLTILTEQTRTRDEIDAAAVEKELVDARGMKITDDASFTTRSNAIQRAQGQLRFVSPQD